MVPQELNQSHVEVATFAGGCFWCMVQPFENTPGVSQVISGYADGTGENPTYQDFVQKGYTEAVQITYDPQKITYEKLLDIFWRQIDPTDPGGQFYDRGPQYKTAIFYRSDKQKQQAEKSRENLEQTGLFFKKIVTEIRKFTNFYPAEQYHQQYYKKSPEHYQAYKTGSGRADFIKKIWTQDSSKRFEKPSDQELRKKLTPLQFDVTQREGTEPAFENEYWDNKAAGIYVDRVSGEPLFSSLDKYDSGTGWPSFTRPIEPTTIEEKIDTKLFMPRTEVHSQQAKSHLGHVFSDGPPPIGIRYCVNSAALRFIPVEDLEKEGYGEYKALFGKK